MPRHRCEEVWCPNSVLRELYEIERRWEPGHTALNVADRSWPENSRTGCRLVIFDKAEAVRLVQALLDVARSEGAGVRCAVAAQRVANAIITRFELQGEDLQFGCVGAQGGQDD